MKDVQQLFIFGITPRSGTNLLRRLILLHPDCCQADVVGEDFLLRHSTILFDYVDAVHGSWSELWDWSSVTKKEQSERLLLEIKDALNRYLYPADTVKKKYVVTTTPYVIGSENVRRLFPDARVLILIRNGKSVVESGVMGGFWNYEEGIELWKESAKVINKLSQQDGVYVVKYEDLLIENYEAFKKALNFLGLDISKYPWDEIEKLPVFGSSTNRPDGNFRYEIKDKPKNFAPESRAAGWSNVLHYRFDSQCHLFQRDFGYEKEEYPLKFYYAAIAMYYRAKRKTKRLIISLSISKRGFSRVYAGAIKAR